MHSQLQPNVPRFSGELRLLCWVSCLRLDMRAVFVDKITVQTLRKLDQLEKDLHKCQAHLQQIGRARTGVFWRTHQSYRRFPQHLLCVARYEKRATKPPARY